MECMMLNIIKKYIYITFLCNKEFVNMNLNPYSWEK